MKESKLNKYSKYYKMFLEKKRKRSFYLSKKLGSYKKLSLKNNKNNTIKKPKSGIKNKSKINLVDCDDKENIRLSVNRLKKIEEFLNSIVTISPENFKNKWNFDPIEMSPIEHNGNPYKWEKLDRVSQCA